MIAESFERIHRSNLIGMGILPLEFKNGETAVTHNLTGKEQYSLSLNKGDLKVGQEVIVSTNDGKKFATK